MESTVAELVRGNDPEDVAVLDLSSLPSSAPATRLRKIAGLQQLVNLRVLDLSGNSLSRLDHLGSLARLEELDI